MLSSIFPSADDHLPCNGFLGTTFFDDILVDFPPPQLVFSPSGSDNSNRKTSSSNSGSDEREVKPMDEHRRRRMISNRESAKRSRMRKQKHLENLRHQVNRYKTGNRELMNRLQLVNHNGQLVCRQNERLQSESVMLQLKLWDLHHVLAIPELHHQLLASNSCMAMQ